MNLRTSLAEKPYSCPVITEETDKTVTFGNMQVRTFSSAENNDKEINEFLTNTMIYILSISTIPVVAENNIISIVTRIVHRLITFKDK